MNTPRDEIKLTPEDSLLLIEILENPSEPNEHLKAAMKLYKEYDLYRAIEDEEE